MSYKVSTFNSESGWSLGTFLSEAVTEEDAVAEAAKRYGVEGLTGFRHVATFVADAAEVVQPVADVVAEAAPVVAAEAPSVAPEADEAEKIASALKSDDSLLARVAAKLNALAGG